MSTERNGNAGFTHLKKFLRKLSPISGMRPQTYSPVLSWDEQIWKMSLKRAPDY